MRREWWRCLWVVGVVATCLLFGPGVGETAEGRSYRVQGQVVAINYVDQPNLIVVKTPVTSRSDMTVGAAVTAQTKIVRGGKSITLQAVRVGETVWLTYVKRRDGVVAQLIQLRA